MLINSGVSESAKDCIWVERPVCSRREDFVRLGKVLLQSISIDYNRIPTYRTGSGEDHSGCCNGLLQPKGCMRLCKYPAWSNEPSLWVMNCLVMVGRSWLGNKLSIMVQGRSLCSLLNGGYPKDWCFGVASIYVHMSKYISNT